MNSFIIIKTISISISFNFIIPNPNKIQTHHQRIQKDCHTSIASKLITPYNWWLRNKVKIFSPQYNFLRPSLYDLRTEENDANFLPYQIKKSHHVSYQKFFQYKKPENYLFFNPKYTSPFTSNSEYLIDHTKTKGKLRNYDPLKQSFLFLPNDNPKRPIFVPQEYLILNDDSLLQEEIPQNISDNLPPLQHIASQPLGDGEKPYYHAMAKKVYSYNEFLFIISHLLSLLIKGSNNEHKKTKTTLQRKQKWTFLYHKVSSQMKNYKNTKKYWTLKNRIIIQKEMLLSLLPKS